MPGLVTGACACLELLAHQEPLAGADPNTEEGAEMGLAHNNLPQKMPLCYHPPQPEVALVHVVS